MTIRTNSEADASTPKPQTMDNAESTLKTKLKQLQRAEEKADQALKGEKQSAIETIDESKGTFRWSWQC